MAAAASEIPDEKGYNNKVTVLVGTTKGPRECFFRQL
jgi:hypothetical protein